MTIFRGITVVSTSKSDINMFSLLPQAMAQPYVRENWEDLAEDLDATSKHAETNIKSSKNEVSRRHTLP